LNKETIRLRIKKKQAMNIGENIRKIKSELPKKVKLLPVSKRQPAERIMAAYDAGQRLFGENKAQDLKERYEKFPKDIEWHFIGHLQRNKVKYIAPYVKAIHSVDSLRLLKKINSEAEKNKRVIDCMLQLHIAEEESKFGLSCERAAEIIETEEYKAMKNIRITGIMGMATNTEDSQKIREEYIRLRECFKALKEKFFSEKAYFADISAGMSNDYPIAVEEGSTIVRVGSLIFGPREY
jgi:pyridoxal phosphate enzyme (YggS family)